MTALASKPGLRWTLSAAAISMMLCLAAPLPLSAQAQEETTKVELATDEKGNQAGAVDADMVLSELNHLAEELENQRKFSRILLKKIDEMQDRIDQLEATSQAALSKPDPSGSPMPPAEIEPPAEGGTQNDNGKTQPNRPPAEEDHAEKNGQDDFEQFLDMGETMLRRFFGLVKDLRKEFEDNRA